MAYLDMLIDAAQRPTERILTALDGLSAQQANAFPASATAPTIKSVTWLAWHTAREQDLQVSELAGTETVWVAQGWRERFGLDLPDDTEDWQHTPEEAARVVVDDIALLGGYLKAATTATVSYLHTVAEDSLEDVVDDSWQPPVTRAVRLASIIDDAAMHSGQAVYARRLLTDTGR